MKRFLTIIAALAGLAAAADARVITYTWVQTSSTKPGLDFTAYYRVTQGSSPHSANSGQPTPDFGGLVDLYVEGNGYPAITLTDLIPACQDPSGCFVVPPGCGDPPDPGCGIPYDYNFPIWSISVPDLLYVYAASFDYEPYHFEWDYWLTPTSIQLNDDNGANGCYDQYDCYATGYWQPDYAPEPATLFVFGGGLALAGLMILRSRRRIG